MRDALTCSFSVRRLNIDCDRPIPVTDCDAYLAHVEVLITVDYINTHAVV